MSETETGTDQSVKPIPFGARVWPEDKQYVTEFISKYSRAHEGFKAFVNVVRDNLNATPTPKEDPVTEEPEPVNPNQFIMEFTPYLMDKLKALRRWLKSKGKIPTDSTEIEFLQTFTEDSLKNLINSKYNFLNRE